VLSVWMWECMFGSSGMLPDRHGNAKGQGQAGGIPPLAMRSAASSICCKRFCCLKSRQRCQRLCCPKSRKVQTEKCHECPYIAPVDCCAAGLAGGAVPPRAASPSPVCCAFFRQNSSFLSVLCLQWGELVELFRQELYRLNTLPPTSLLSIHLQASPPPAAVLFAMGPARLLGMHDQWTCSYAGK